MPDETNYNSWTKTGLIQRLKELEGELKRRNDRAAQPVVGPAAAVAAVDDESPDAAASEAKKKGPKGSPHAKRKIDPSRYSSRFIALKLAYLGKNYGGFEFQAMGNQPSIEEELWNALTKACLIFPQDERVVQFDCCEYSKCGRTDRGVSAFGQVIGLRVRSNRPVAKKRVRREEGRVSGEATGQEEVCTTTCEEEAAAVAGKGEVMEGRDQQEGQEEEQEVPFDDLKDEICYPRILNRLLPDDIRILAWCPSPPADFSARFSCRERQYRYFFTQPAFMPDPTAPAPATETAGSESSEGKHSLQPGWLDIEAMRDAAKRFEGDHDFRNFCKIDPAKQITNFRRRIFESDIVQVQDASSALPFLQRKGYSSSSSSSPSSSSLASAGPYPKVYYFHVRGSAFLWHQIRHMVAILFLVGQRLESPALVSELLNTDKNPCRPSYVMADEVPLVLWDCIFPDLATPAEQDNQDDHRRIDCMNWIYVGDEYPPNKFGQFGVMESTWRLWRGHKMDELLSAQLLDKISQQGQQQQQRGCVTGDTVPPHGDEGRRINAKTGGGASERIFEGGNGGRLGGRYVPVMKKELLQPVEEQNDRYARRKGYADAADMRAQRYGDGGESEGEEGD
ncbi:hypothetical protein E4U55_005498 [Claviceps digitariae]|nr:hypothetical protein E4U55_005498 [Claviceps digitariae]